MIAALDDDDLLFAEEDDGPAEPAAQRQPWRVLMVDDDREMHAVSTLALNGVTVDGSPLEVIHAYSGAEARAKLRAHDDIAVALLDVVMETDDAGLQVARYIRQELGNHQVRVVLRTGQPGMAPERTVIREYDINDYWSKTELTADRLRTLMTGGVRSYRDIHTIARHRAGLAQVIEATGLLFQSQALDQLIEATLTQLSSILMPPASALFFHARGHEGAEPVVAAGTGRFRGDVGRALAAVLSADEQREIDRSLERGDLAVTASRGAYAFRRADATEPGPEAGIYMEGIGEPTDWERNILALFCSNASVSYVNQRQHEHRVALNRSTLRFVPLEFLQQLGRKSLLGVSTGDHVEKEMSVLFSDIRGFTSLIEGLGPSESFAFINDYLRFMEPAVRDHGGFIDSYEGDAVMALFAGGADDAVRAGVASQRALVRFNAERVANGKRPIAIGVGINTGPLMLGTIGTDQRLKCGVIGDAVNLASRVEGMTKRYGASLLVTEFTRARMRDPAAYAMRAIDRVRVRGRAEAVTVYEVLDALDDTARARRAATGAAFAAAWEAYRRGDMAVAGRGFGEVLGRDPGDGAALLFRGRCERYAATGVPDGWDGVEALTEK